MLIKVWSNAGHWLVGRYVVLPDHIHLSKDEHVAKQETRHGELILLVKSLKETLAPVVKLDELVSATLPLEKINDGFAALKGGEVARQLVTFD